jgi:energy-coupling factor transporter transmembrane protein EcfT
MRTNLIAGIDPRAKIVAFLTVQALLFVPMAKPPLVRLGAVAIPLLLLLPIAGSSWRIWLRTLALAAPLLAFWAASVFLLPVSAARAVSVASLMLGKSILVFLALALFVLNEDAGRSLQALRQTGLPRAAAVILALGYRFAGQMRLELEGMHRTWKGRNFSSLPRLRRAKRLGSALPLFFERFLDSGVHVHDAMVARGFNGMLPQWRRLSFSERDAAFLAIVAMVTAAITVL